VVEPIPDPIDLALRSKKWAKTSVRELELESEKEQRELYGCCPAGYVLSASHTLNQCPRN
jgi:hypothetical protein